MAKRPLDILDQVLNRQPVIVSSRAAGFRGVLQGYDVHMNLVLDRAEEVAEDGQVRGVGTLIVRGDNVIYISPSVE